MDNIKLEDGKDITTINYEFLEKERVPSLFVFAGKCLYYINVNFLYNLRKLFTDASSCSCASFLGCENSNGEKNYCNICSLLIKFDVEENEENYNYKHLIETNIALRKDLIEINDIDVEGEDYKFKSNDNGINCFFSDLIFTIDSETGRKIKVRLIFHIKFIF